MSATFSGHSSNDDWASVDLTTPIAAYDFSFVGWFKVPATGSSEDVLYNLRNSASAEYARIAVDNAGTWTNSEPGRAGLHMQRVGGGTSYGPNFDNAFAFGSWFHLGLTFTANNAVEVRVNAQALPPLEPLATRTILANGGLDQLVLASASTAGSHGSPASMAELALFPSALTDKEWLWLQMAKPDAIGKTFQNYWDLTTSWADNGGDGDDLVYNPSANGPITWSAEDHPRLVGAATITSLNLSPFFYGGVKYETADLPITVPATVLGFFERWGIGSGTYADNSAQDVTFSKAMRLDGVAYAQGQEASLSMAAAGLAVGAGFGALS